MISPKPLTRMVLHLPPQAGKPSLGEKTQNPKIAQKVAGLMLGLGAWKPTSFLPSSENCYQTPGDH